MGHWQGQYDGRSTEARLNRLDHFWTGIDGMDIHFRADAWAVPMDWTRYQSSGSGRGLGEQYQYLPGPATGRERANQDGYSARIDQAADFVYSLADSSAGLAGPPSRGFSKGKERLLARAPGRCHDLKHSARALRISGRSSGLAPRKAMATTPSRPSQPTATAMTGTSVLTKISSDMRPPRRANTYRCGLGPQPG
jgi:hypothetical protein